MEEDSYTYVILPVSSATEKQSLRACQLLYAVKYYYASEEDSLATPITSQMLNELQLTYVNTTP